MSRWKNFVAQVTEIRMRENNNTVQIAVKSFQSQQQQLTYAIYNKRRISNYKSN